MLDLPKYKIENIPSYYVAVQDKMIFTEKMPCTRLTIRMQFFQAVLKCPSQTKLISQNTFVASNSSAEETESQTANC